ncbi:hypothetical protein [Nocardia sp. NPDC127526]|uniref:hypothetical protein n=1 Tax=Nocardia sp. NPDC127526 TaxID=3345393 RepID=UPI003625C75E
MVARRLAAANVFLAGVLLLVDLAAVVLVWRGGLPVAYPGGRYGASDKAEFVWASAGGALLVAVYLLALAAAVAPSVLLARRFDRIKGAGLVWLGVALLPLAGALASLHWALYPLILDTTCGICDAITYEAAPGPVWYRPVRMALMALLAACFLGAVALACSPGMTRRLHDTAPPVPRRPGAATVAAVGLTVLAGCATLLAATVVPIATTAQQHRRTGELVRVDSGTQIMTYVVAVLAVVFAMGTLRQAQALWRGNAAAAPMLTLSGLSLLLWSGLLGMLLLLTPKGGILPTGWRVEVDPSWLPEVHGVVVCAALAALAVAGVALLWPTTLSWIIRPDPR